MTATTMADFAIDFSIVIVIVIDIIIDIDIIFVISAFCSTCLNKNIFVKWV